MSSGTTVQAEWGVNGWGEQALRFTVGNGERILAIPTRDPSLPFEVAWWRSDGEPRWYTSLPDDDGQLWKDPDYRHLSWEDLVLLVQSLSRGEIPTTDVLRPDR